MKKIIVLIVLCSPGFSYSQDSIWNKGIQFENGLDWQHVLERAKEEGKDIFIDCYATWCGPCKLMDNEVYPKRNVGDYVNARFISIKLQADSSIKDDRFVQSRYNEARTILDRYGVTAFPTYLFFSSDGKIIHRFSGFLPDSLFLKVVSHALDSNYQYYKRIEKYKSGKMSYTDMPKLAYAARENGDVKFAIDVAKNYLENYLYKDKEEELCTQENLQLVRSFYSHILNSKDKVFSVLYTEGKKADDAIKSKGFSKVVVESIITKEMIDPELWPDNKPIKESPNWNKLISSVKKRYNRQVAERTVLDAQLRWYNERKEWPEITKYTVKKITKFGVDTTGILDRAITNNIMYLVIFEHSNESEELNAAIKVMKSLVNTESDRSEYRPLFIDTYANLLYKVGRLREALAWEEKAVQLSSAKDILQAFEKMKRKEPTWE